MSISPNRGRNYLATLNHSGIKKTNNYLFSKKENIKPDQITRSHIYQVDPQPIKQRTIDSRTISIHDQYSKYRTTEELEKKVQIILKHNSHLLAQNASLSELLCQKNSQIQNLHVKLQTQSIGEPNTFWIQIQKKKLLEDIERRESNHNEQIQKMLQEISRLHDQCYSLQNTKNLQMHKIKESYEKQFYNQIQNLKRNQNSNIELYETQIRKLKEQLEQKTYAIQGMTHQTKISHDRLNEEVFRLVNQNKHLVKIRQLQLQQCRMHYENQVHNKFREYQRKMQLEANNVENTIRKLKKELTEKNVELQKLANRLGKTNQENQAEIQQIKDEKQKLKVQIAYIQELGKEALKQQKQRLHQFAQLQLQTVQTTKNNYIDSLKSENEKLIYLNDCKSNQIKHLYDQIKGMRESSSQQFSLLKKKNEELQQKIYKIQLQNHEEIELLKIKMAELHQSDVKSIRQYLQNQIFTLTQQLENQQKVNKISRQTIQKQIQQKNQIRKTFQNQLTKYKVKCSDLKIKLAAVNVQMKAQITSMASKMELTSQTFLRQQSQKQKNQAFDVQEKKKYHQIVHGKDNQIKTLTAKIQRQKILYQTQIQNLKQQLEAALAYTNQLEEINKKQKQFYEGQIKKKESKLKSQIELLKKEIDDNKGGDPNNMKSQMLKLQKEVLRLTKQLEFTIKQQKNIQQQLNLKNGYIETVQLESSAAIQQERSKVKILMNKNESGLKSYYEQKIINKNHQIETLTEKLNEKDQDLRDIISKYNSLQQRLKMLLQSQQKLRDFQNKIMNLGMDNNLIKNLAELFKNKV